MVVERALAEEGTSRQELGRQAFEERAWAWRQQYGGSITDQLRRLGASCDWSREAFTLDGGLSRAFIAPLPTAPQCPGVCWGRLYAVLTQLHLAVHETAFVPRTCVGTQWYLQRICRACLHAGAVTEAFKRLNDQGLIYRGTYMVNWAPKLQTAVSDLEVEYSDESGLLYFFKYALADSPEEYLPIATTRPETILGDSAVAVHPEDKRYAHFVGNQVQHEAFALHTNKQMPSSAVNVLCAWFQL